MIVMAILISTNALNFLQRDVPGYTSALQNSLEGSTSVRHQLADLKGGPTGSLSRCDPSATNLISCGTAPNFSNITAWLNTPRDRPLTMSSLRGKVVLVDFWTYSCINCQRSLPHVEAWYQRYAPDGLEVVGVHTPEFAFEHVVSNVASAAKSLGVKYPIAVDDDYATWNAYSNEYWPAEYLIDASGVVRHVDFGEGSYAQTEQLIRTLLTAAHPGLTLPPPTSVPNLTPTDATNPESYVGYHYGLEYLQSPVDPVDDRALDYRFPSTLSPASFALAGRWTIHAEEATAGSMASLELNYFARDVYLVMGGHGTVQVSGGGIEPRTIHVGGVPRLYTLLHFATQSSGTMMLHVSPGVQAFDFTFG
jgi:thiol-disulfide isomerase/thioredoxin